MSVDLYVALIGLFRLGAAAVFVDPSAGPEGLNRCIERVRPDAFVGVPYAHLLRLRSAALRSVPKKMSMGGFVPGARRVGRRVTVCQTAASPCAPATPAIITFTSGSTGAPKAAVRTHGFLTAQHRALVESLAVSADDIDLATLPIFVLSNLATGTTTVIADGDLRRPAAIDPAPLLRQIVRARPTTTVASPALLERLARHALGAHVRLESFRRIFTGGAPVFPRTLSLIAEAAPRASVVAVYGSTEAEPIAEIDFREIDSTDRDAMQQGAGLLAGRPVRSIDLRILPDRWGTPLGPWSAADLDREALGPNSAGEIVVSGDHVLPGYFEGIGDEETKIHVGDRIWHRTGDAGRLDNSGRLWLLGRCGAKVSDGRDVLYPFAVECAASEIPSVERTAFVLYDEKRTLVVESRENAAPLSANELMARLSWAHIERVVSARIPVDKRHNAKVDYPALQRMLRR